MNIKDRSRKIMQSIDALTLRERLFVFAALLVLVSGAWEALLARPLANQEDAARRSMQAAQSRLDQLDESIAIAAQGMDGGNSAYFERLRLLRSSVSESEDTVRIFTSDLVDPAQMRFVIQDLIRRQDGLDLVRAANLEVRPVIEQEENPVPRANGVRPMLYRHAMMLELEGSYLDCLTYLESIERLPWQIYWSRLNLETIEHPRIRIAIEIHTLSLDEEWIGV
jgi:MSHA biogenesis protein MshJ